MTGSTMFQVLTALGATSDDAARVAAGSLAALSDRHGAAKPAPFDGPPAQALQAATSAIARAEGAERELVWAQQQLPAVEQRVAEQEKGARGRWVLPLVLVIIVLAIVLGQMF